MSEQVKGIPEERICCRCGCVLTNPGGLFGKKVCLSCNHLQCTRCPIHAPKPTYEEIEARIARSEQALAALEARNKKAEALLLRWNKAAGWYCAGSEFVDDPERVFESIKSRMEMREKLGQRKAETAARAALKGAS